MEITLNSNELALLRYVIELYYELYARPPFEDIDAKFDSVMDVGANISDIVDKLDQRQAAIDKNDIMDEIGVNDDPNTPGYLTQLMKAEFLAISTLVRRWYNGFQYSLLMQSRYGSDREKILANYWGQEQPTRVFFLPAESDEDDTTMILQPDAVLDIKPFIHLIAHFSQTVTPEIIKLRAKEKAGQVVERSEEKISEQIIHEMIVAHMDNYYRFIPSVSGLIGKMAANYRLDKFGFSR